jgi:Flp pilus assembly protein TadG
MIPTAAGFLVFILFLLLAVQVLYGLYATSTVRGTLNDAASRAANGLTGVSDDRELRRIADDAERTLGPMGDRTTIELRLDDDDADGVPDVVIGSAVADPPRFVPPLFAGVLGLDDIDVSVRVRIERFR